MDLKLGDSVFIVMKSLIFRSIRKFCQAITEPLTKFFVESITYSLKAPINKITLSGMAKRQYNTAVLEQRPLLSLFTWVNINGVGLPEQTTHIHS